MPTSYEIKKRLSDKHPQLTANWRKAHGKKGGYPPLKYWEEKGYYSSRAVKAQRAVQRREHLFGKGVSKQDIETAKNVAKKHTHYVEHIPGTNPDVALLRYNKMRAAKSQKIGK